MDLDDKVYDWNIKATCILEFNELCDQYKLKERSPLNANGRFKSIAQDNADLEQEMYETAKEFQFSVQPKQLKHFEIKLQKVIERNKVNRDNHMYEVKLKIKKLNIEKKKERKLKKLQS